MLDTLVLPQETKNIAEETFAKKRMYYNMRIRSLKRRVSNKIQLSRSGKSSQMQIKEKLLHELKCQQSSQQEMQSIAYLSQKIQVAKQDIGLIEQAHCIAVERCIQRQSECTDRMMVEMETGGNIRFEQGKPQDSWYQSCEELMLSRFTTQELSGWGIFGCKVNGITRLYNRFVENRFEEKISNLCQINKNLNKSNVAYAFFGVNVSCSNLLERCCEEGLPFICKGPKQQFIELHNSPSQADFPRFISAVEKQMKQKKYSNPQKTQVLLCKVFLGEVYYDNCPFDNFQEGVQNHGFGELSAISEKIEDEARYNSICKCKSGKQKVFYINDGAQIKPEYIIDFEYCTEKDSQTKIALDRQHSMVDEELQDQDYLIRNITAPLETWLPKTLETYVAQNLDQLHLQAPDSSKQRNKLYEISQQFLHSHCQPTDLIQLSYLNLCNNCIRKIENLEGCHNLKVLNLSFNSITRIEGLSTLEQLESLDLGSNLIKKIEGLRGLKNLNNIELNNNLISRLEDFNYLAKNTPKVTSIDIRGNPVIECKRLMNVLIRRLPKLKFIDGQCTKSLIQKSLIQGASFALTPQIIKQHALFRQTSLWDTLSQCQAYEDKGVMQSKTLETLIKPNWEGGVCELIIDHQNIRRIQYINSLTNLQRLSFFDNEIVKIEEMEELQQLRDLNLEENQIQTVLPLSQLRSLSCLELSKNLITQLEGLGCLTGLRQLCLEENYIQSMKELAHLVNLMELYLGYNTIDDLKEFLFLKDLPKLIIADFQGNKVCTQEEYRSYVIYHLKRLKILDGASIDAEEQAKSKSKYSGKLTMDVLQDIIGHKFFDDIQNLDLSGLKIKDVGTIFQEDQFKSLIELNMDNNTLSDVQSFLNMSSLQVLTLNHNSINEGACFVWKSNCTEVNTVGLSSLQVLQLGDNQIQSLGGLGLSSISSLRCLFLQGNELTKVEHLNGLVLLEELVLDRNKIKSIDANSFAGLSNLRELRMEHNNLRSIQNFSHLISLQSLHLGYNRLMDVSELEQLQQMSSIQELSLVNNPVSKKQVYRAVVIFKCPNIMILDGVKVSIDEREYAHAMFDSIVNFSSSSHASRHDGDNNQQLQMKVFNIAHSASSISSNAFSEYQQRQTSLLSEAPVSFFDAKPAQSTFSPKYQTADALTLCGVGFQENNENKHRRARSQKIQVQSNSQKTSQHDKIIAQKIQPDRVAKCTGQDFLRL